MVRTLVHGKPIRTFNFFLMFMHVPVILPLTSQKLKKVSMKFCEPLPMKPGKEIEVSSNKSET